MKLTAAIAEMPERAHMRALELVPELGLILDGEDAEVAKRWARFANAFGPIVKRNDPEFERNVTAIVRFAAKLSPRDIGMLLGTATRCALRLSVGGSSGRSTSKPVLPPDEGETVRPRAPTIRRR